jgi:hypothetical protein
VGQAGENNLRFELGTVQLRDDVLTVSMVANSQESGGSVPASDGRPREYRCGCAGLP